MPAAGIAVAGPANNHANDYGSEAPVHTVELLEAARVVAPGGGANHFEAYTQPSFAGASHRRRGGKSPQSRLLGPEVDHLQLLHEISICCSPNCYSLPLRRSSRSRQWHNSWPLPGYG